MRTTLRAAIYQATFKTPTGPYSAGQTVYLTYNQLLALLSPAAISRGLKGTSSQAIITLLTPEFYKG